MIYHSPHTPLSRQAFEEALKIQELEDAAKIAEREQTYSQFMLSRHSRERQAEILANRAAAKQRHRQQSLKFLRERLIEESKWEEVSPRCHVDVICGKGGFLTSVSGALVAQQAEARAAAQRQKEESYNAAFAEGEVGFRAQVMTGTVSLI